MPHRSAKKPATRQPREPYHVSLTVDERDAIDAAKLRLRRLTALAYQTLERGEDLLGDIGDDAGMAVGDLLLVMLEDVATIDSAFKAADARSGGAK